MHNSSRSHFRSLFNCQPELVEGGFMDGVLPGQKAMPCGPGAYIFLLLLVFITPYLNAQDKHTRVDLKPYEEVVETLRFTSGFVLKTDRPRVVGKQPKKLIRYNESGEQVWSIEIKPLYDKLDLDKLMATPN